MCVGWFLNLPLPLSWLVGVAMHHGAVAVSEPNDACFPQERAVALDFATETKLLLLSLKENDSCWAKMTRKQGNWPSMCAFLLWLL